MQGDINGPETGVVSGRAVIVNAYSYRNAGDAAIMISTADLLRDLGFSEVLLSTRYERDAESYRRHNVEVIPPLIPFAERRDGSSHGRGPKFLFSSAVAVLLLSLPKRLVRQSGFRRLIHRVIPSLAVLAPGTTAVIAGGGYLYSSKRRINLSFLHSLVTLWISRRLVPDLLVMPASIGPIDRRLDRVLVELACRGTEMVLRETVSTGAGRFNPRLGETRLCPDVAFYGKASLSRRSYTVAREPVVRMVAMDWTWSRSVSAGRMEAYLDCMAEIADQLALAGYVVEIGGHSVIPEHGQNDIAICEEIASRAKSDIVLDSNADVDYLWQRYAEVEVVIGTRLHACIMAISVGTPAVVLAYQEKSFGVMATAGVPADVFRVDDLDVEKIVHACLEAASEGARQTVALTGDRARLRIREVLGVS